MILTSNPSSDVIKGYTPGVGVAVFSIPSAVPGPVGVAWDSTRDEYVVCDWEDDQIWVIDAATLTTARILPVPLTRMAGVAYDCFDDVYVVGDRDTNLHSLLNPLTGAVGLQYMTAGTLTSDPRGAALSDDGGIWTGDFSSNNMYEQEAGHGPMSGGCGNSSVGDNYCASVANSAGGPAIISGTGSTSVAANSLTLNAAPVPDQPGIFYYGQTQTQQPFGNGFRCISGSVVRLPIVNGSGNTAQYTVDLAAQGIVPGTYDFQYWFRDPAGGGAFFNLSDGLEIVFVP